MKDFDPKKRKYMGWNWYFGDDSANDYVVLGIMHGKKDMTFSVNLKALKETLKRIGEIPKKEIQLGSNAKLLVSYLKEKNDWIKTSELGKLFGSNKAAIIVLEDLKEIGIVEEREVEAKPKPRREWKLNID
jgi:hypothetical protein